MLQKKTFWLYAIACLLMAAFAVNASVAAEMGKIDINSATQKELMTLKGVGEKVAASIIAYREAEGPFKSPQEIMKVKGCGSKTFAKNKDRIVATMPNKTMKK